MKGRRMVIPAAALLALFAGCAAGEEAAADPEDGVPAAIVAGSDSVLDTIPLEPSEDSAATAPPSSGAVPPPASAPPRDDRLRDSVRQGPLIELPTVEDTAEAHTGH